MIKAVIFDFFGVICTDDFWRFVKADRQDDTDFHTYANNVNLGVIDWPAFVRKVADTTNASVAEVNKMYQDERIDPRVVALIDKLRANYKTALLTNAHHTFIDNILEQKNLLPLFDAVIISSREGVIKPDPAIFLTGLNKLGIKPEQAVYVDDLERHVEAARGVGMQAIHYKNFYRFKADLEKILKTNL